MKSNIASGKPNEFAARQQRAARITLATIVTDRIAASSLRSAPPTGIGTTALRMLMRKMAKDKASKRQNCALEERRSVLLAIW